MNNKRAIHLLVVFCVLFMSLISYITYIEIRYGNTYTQSAYNARNTTREKTVIRGSIYDRNMTQLAYSDKINGVITRHYPFNNLYSQVIGYVSVDYDNRSLLEKAYNEQLLGGDSINSVLNIKNQLKNDNTTGNDLVLTLDQTLQQTAYDALGSFKGSVVAMNPQSGEILAMVSKPDFNPNPEVLAKEYDTLEDSALYSRALQISYPPGSTFKTVTSASIIDNGLSGETYNDTKGEFVIKASDGNSKNDYTCKNEDAKHAYGLTNLKTGFQYSSNVYFAYMGTKLTTKQLQSTASEFYFNKTIPFDIPVKKSTFQTGNMTEAERAISSIGQGQTEATPLHLALIASTIANGGIMPKPYLVSNIRSGSVTTFSATAKALGRITDTATAKEIKDMMHSVVSSGTGKKAQISGVQVCGKTGTSENALTASDKENSKKTHAIFIGFAPYDNPQIAVSVVVEYAGFGGDHAAPIAKKVMEKYLSQATN